jgi:hypothetical protein
LVIHYVQKLGEIVKFTWTILPIFLIQSSPVLANTSFSVSPQVDQAISDNFKEDPIAVRSLLERFYYMKMQELSAKDDIKWEVNRKKYWESLYCSQFVVGSSLDAAEKVAKIRALFLQADGMKNYDADEIQKLMSNRELRRRTFKDFKGIENKDKHKYCTFALSKEFIEERQKEFASRDTNSLMTASKFEHMHPKLRASAQSLLQKFSGGKPPTEKTFSDTMMAMTTQLMPIMETKSKLEFLPQVEKKCPGTIQKFWEKCKGGKFYPALLFPNLSKELCFQDHQMEAPSACKSI